MICPKCGNKVKEGDVFCTNCGAKIEKGQGKSQTTNEIKNILFKINAAIQKIMKKEWMPLVIIVIIAILMADVIGKLTKTTSEDNSSKTITKTTSKGNSSKTITKGDIYEAIAEAMEFDISDDAIAFINDNPQFFPCNISNMVAASAYVDFNLDYAHVAKNPFKYSDRFMCEPGEVIDCQEIEENGNALTYLQIEDDFGYNYCVYYLGELPDVFEGSHVTAEFLPFDVITFENMGGYYTEAIVGAACYVE